MVILVEPLFMTLSAHSFAVSVHIGVRNGKTKVHKMVLPLIYFCDKSDLLDLAARQLFDVHSWG